jgi:hypothetical protein
VSTDLECDALAILVVRLEASRPTGDHLCWHRWYEAIDAGAYSLQAGRADATPPHKQFPTLSRPQYFAPHVQRLLFPEPQSSSKIGASSERWLCCPKDMSLDIGWKQDDQRRANIELLERLSIPRARSGSIGLIHLALQAEISGDPTGTLKWANDMRKTYPRWGKPQFVLTGELGDRTLDGRRPYRDLVTELFGDPDDELERHLCAIFFAKEPVTTIPSEQTDRAADLAAWSHALGYGSRRDTDHDTEGEQPDPQEATAQHASLGLVQVVIVGRNVAFITPNNLLNGEAVRNFRSYWSESLIFALLQHDRLEHLAGRLADLGFDPSTESLDQLYDEWLAFRNIFWWSQPSTTTNVPQTLVQLVRAEYGTERLFADLEADFATYAARRRWRMEDDQAHALANLQIYGAAVAVSGSLATIAALLHPTHTLLAITVCIVIAAGIVAALFVHRRLPRRTDTQTR